MGHLVWDKIKKPFWLTKLTCQIHRKFVDLYSKKIMIILVLSWKAYIGRKMFLFDASFSIT